MTRRARDSGTIYESGGRWRAATHDATGKRVYVSGFDKKDATAKLRKAEDAIAAGTPVRSDKLTLDAYLDQWLAAVGPNLRPRTLDSYQNVLRLHVRPPLGHVALARLRASDVQSLIAAQLKAGRSARSVAYVHAILRAALTKAEKWQLVPRNVAKLVDSPRAEQPEVRPLSPSQAGKLLASVEGQDRALYLLALGLGLRQGEVLGLRWQDVDLDTGSLNVRHTLQRIGGKAMLCEPKTAKSRRALALPEPVLLSLREQRRRQVADRLAVGSAWQDGDFVFATPIGTPLDGSNVLHKFQRQVEKAGLPHQRFHDLRHGCASYLLSAGVPMRVVMETLGHSQLSTTADIYSHVSPELQRDAAARMGGLLDSIAK